MPKSRISRLVYGLSGKRILSQCLPPTTMPPHEVSSSRRLGRGPSAEEILATLDSEGGVDGLPFMAEMLQYCGRRFRVFKSAHKSCNTLGGGGIRRMPDAVFLEDLRCDGQAHGGCQAGCLLFWKKAVAEARRGFGTSGASCEDRPNRSP